MNLRKVTIWLSVLMLLGVVGLFSLGNHDNIVNLVCAVVGLTPLCSFPFIVNCVLAYKWKNRWSLGILATTSVMYGLWFTSVMYDAFYLHYLLKPDPQGGLIILFLGVYSLPVLLPAWIVAWYLNSCFVKTIQSRQRNVTFW